jgi:adenylosuccinate lyase
VNNLEKTGGLFYSQKLMLKLIEKGLTREESYQLVQKNAMEAWKSGKDFEKLILSDEPIKKYLTSKEIEQCFNLKDHLRYLDRIFKRVFTR